MLATLLKVRNAPTVTKSYYETYRGLRKYLNEIYLPMEGITQEVVETD